MLKGGRCRGHWDFCWSARVIYLATTVLVFWSQLRVCHCSVFIHSSFFMVYVINTFSSLHLFQPPARTKTSSCPSVRNFLFPGENKTSIPAWMSLLGETATLLISNCIIVNVEPGLSLKIMKGSKFYLKRFFCQRGS